MIPEFRSRWRDIPSPRFQRSCWVAGFVNGIGSQEQSSARFLHKSGVLEAHQRFLQQTHPSLLSRLLSAVVLSISWLHQNFLGRTSQLEMGIVSCRQVVTQEASANATARVHKVHITNGRRYGTLDVSWGASAGINQGHLGWIRLRSKHRDSYTTTLIFGWYRPAVERR